MTARSTRVAAEQAIIDAAYRWLAGVQQLSDGTYWKAVSDLEAAIVAHQALGLDATSQPIIGNNTTDTSAAAGASLRGLTGYLAQRVNDEIFVTYKRGAVGLTCDQVEIALHGSHQSMSARVNELRDKGWIVDSGTKRKTRSGRLAIVWTPSQAAKEHG